MDSSSEDDDPDSNNNKRISIVKLKKKRKLKELVKSHIKKHRKHHIEQQNQPISQEVIEQDLKEHLPEIEDDDIEGVGFEERPMEDVFEEERESTQTEYHKPAPAYSEEPKDKEPTPQEIASNPADATMQQLKNEEVPYQKGPEQEKPEYMLEGYEKARLVHLENIKAVPDGPLKYFHPIRDKLKKIFLGK